MDLSWHQISPMVGYVLHVEAVKEVIDQFSNQSGGTYVLQSKEKRFGASDYVKEKFRVRYADIDGKNSVVPEDGKPFVILSQCIYACHHGPDKNKTKKIAYKVQQLLARERDHPYTIPRQTRFIIRSTKKKNCPAKITIKEVLMFQPNEDDVKTVWHRRRISRQIRDLLLDNREQLNYQKRYYIRLPTDSDHHDTHPLEIRP